MLYPLYVHHDDAVPMAARFRIFRAALPRLMIWPICRAWHRRRWKCFFDGEDAEIAQPGDISRLTSDAAVSEPWPAGAAAWCGDPFLSPATHATRFFARPAFHLFC